MLTLVAVFAMISDTAAQCTITTSATPPCLGSPMGFSGSSVGSTHDWDFNGEGTQSGSSNVSFAFKTPGNKTITYITTINGTKCTATVKLVIKTLPKIKVKLQKNIVYQQCFSKNLFCFTDSSFNPNGSPIAKIRYVVSDGQYFDYPYPTMPQTLCFSIKDPRGGVFDLFVEVTDANGCLDTLTLRSAVKVFPQ
ncbi:MAG: hypothetical protein WCH09_09855, partial [Bacteroidota bacterium]